MAHKVGCDPSYMSDVERGKQNPSMKLNAGDCRSAQDPTLQADLAGRGEIQESEAFSYSLMKCPCLTGAVQFKDLAVISIFCNLAQGLSGLLARWRLRGLPRALRDDAL